MSDTKVVEEMNMLPGEQARFRHVQDLIERFKKSGVEKRPIAMAVAIRGIGPLTVYLYSPPDSYTRQHRLEPMALEEHKDGSVKIRRLSSMVEKAVQVNLEAVRGKIAMSLRNLDIGKKFMLEGSAGGGVQLVDYTAGGGPFRVDYVEVVPLDEKATEVWSKEELAYAQVFGKKAGVKSPCMFVVPMTK